MKVAHLLECTPLAGGHRMGMRMVLPVLAVAACYTGAPANRDVQAAWRGRTRAEIVDRWGPPARKASYEAVVPAEEMVWSFRTTHVELPSGSLAITARPVVVGAAAEGPGVAAAVAVHGTALDLAGDFHPGEISHSTTEAAANIVGMRVAAVDGAALHWGPPNDVNLHWGTIFGAHVGMGRLDTTPTPLPSGGAYLGGMVSPTLGLVGTFSLVAGTGDAGSAMGMAGGMAAQWWPVNRLWLRAGPALLLTFDPGFANAQLRPGATLGASYAAFKIGTLAIDARFDMAAGPSTAFGTVGIGVNVN